MCTQEGEGPHWAPPPRALGEGLGRYITPRTGPPLPPAEAGSPPP